MTNTLWYPMILILCMLFITIIPLTYPPIHPLSMILIIISYTISMTIMMNFMFINSWYSYILFLSMVSGMMILFMYFITIKSSKNMQMNKMTMKNFFSKIWLLTIMIMFMWMYYDPINLFLEMNSFDIHPLYSIWSPMNLSINSSHIYSNLSSKMTLMLICYLMLIMLIVTKLCMLTKGSLRIHK